MTLEDYLALFPSASREKPRFMALSRAVLKQASDLIALVESLLSATSFSQAVGLQLDQQAAALGLYRADTAAGPEASDEVFRAFVLAKLALWGWDGTNETVLEVLSVAHSGSTQTDNQDGTVSLSFASALPAPAEALFPFPAGVRAIQT